MAYRSLFFLVALAFAAGSKSAAQAQKRTVIPEADILKVKVRFDSSVDRFTGRSVVAPHDVKTLAGGGALGLSDVSLNLVYAVPPSETAFFYLRIVYNGLGWVFLNGGVEFLIDGSDRAEIHGDGSEKERTTGSCMEIGCMVSEGERISIDTALIARIAHAHSVEVRVLGDRGSLERWFKREHLAQFRGIAIRYGLVSDLTTRESR